jgi:uncharacterized membrane protein
MRLWLWATPLAMLALATLFAVIAATNERWALLAVMVLLALVAVGLFIAQAQLRRRLARNPQRNREQE